ncbi:hypothetical protein IWW50_004812, partial [Coemansia erecta]
IRSRQDADTLSIKRQDADTLSIKRPMEIVPQQSVRAQPSYGSIGLGIRAQTDQPRISSAANARRQRGTRMVANGDALWMLDRKLSAECKETRNFS